MGSLTLAAPRAEESITDSPPSRIPRYAIIPTNGRRCLEQAIEAITPQVDLLVLVNTGGSRGTGWDQFVHQGGDLTLMFDHEDTNISRWWNRALEWIADRQRQVSYSSKWDVAILNDDAIVPPGWFDAVSERMRGLLAAAGCSGGTAPYPILHTTPGPVDLATRMQGFAFILAGEKGARANEQCKWYFSDDHLDWLSRQLGGMVMVPGFPVSHLYPNGQMTPELHAQTARDAEAFVAYWNARPW